MQYIKTKRITCIRLFQTRHKRKGLNIIGYIKISSASIREDRLNVKVNRIYYRKMKKK